MTESIYITPQEVAAFTDHPFDTLPISERKRVVGWILQARDTDSDRYLAMQVTTNNPRYQDFVLVSGVDPESFPAPQKINAGLMF